VLERNPETLKSKKDSKYLRTRDKKPMQKRKISGEKLGAPNPARLKKSSMETREEKTGGARLG